MPLVVPGINSTATGDSKKDEWLNKLVGKKITTEATSDAISFAKKDLPEHHRVLKPNSAMTMDYREDRLNVHLDDNDNVHDVSFG